MILTGQRNTTLQSTAIRMILRVHTPGFIVNERSKVYLGTVEDGLTERGKKVIGHTPMGKFGQAGDMFGCVKFLLDERASSFVTGVTIPVDGGFLTLSGV